MPDATLTTGADGRRDGAVTGMPRLILRSEGAALFIVATAAYAAVGGSWWVFAGLFLVPDLFMLGYLHDRRSGAALYNLGHSTIAPLATVAVGWHLDASLATSIGLIWLAHVGFDRMAGYGLKFPDAFEHTHLGTPFKR